MTSSYRGTQDFVFRARVELHRGRQLTIQEVRALGLLDGGLEHELCRNSPFAFEWFQVEPGDCIILEATDDDSDDITKWALGVTDKSLIDPPDRPDHPYAGRDFLTWLQLNLNNS